MKHIVLCIIVILGYTYYVFSAQNEVLGTTLDGIPAFGNPGKKELNHVEWKGKSIITGLKWECTEFVRRYLLMTRGIIFKDVRQANIIWGLLTFIDVEKQVEVPCMHYGIGTIAPRRGDILIWAVSEEDPDGHVAVILHDQDDQLGNVYIAEQNTGAWTAPYYSRQIHLGSTPHLLGIIRIP